MTRNLTYYFFSDINSPNLKPLTNKLGRDFDGLDIEQKKKTVAIASYAMRSQKSFANAAISLSLDSHLPDDFCEEVDLISQFGLLDLCDCLLEELVWE